LQIIPQQGQIDATLGIHLVPAIELDGLFETGASSFVAMVLVLVCLNVPSQNHDDSAARVPGSPAPARPGAAAGVRPSLSSGAGGSLLTLYRCVCSLINAAHSCSSAVVGGRESTLSKATVIKALASSAVFHGQRPGQKAPMTQKSIRYWPGARACCGQDTLLALITFRHTGHCRTA